MEWKKIDMVMQSIPPSIILECLCLLPSSGPVHLWLPWGGTAKVHRGQRLHLEGNPFTRVSRCSLHVLMVVMMTKGLIVSSGM